MIDKIARYLKKRRQWRRYSRLIAGINSLPEYEQFLAHNPCAPPYITDGERYSPDKRAHAASLLGQLQLDVAGRPVLDIGPGYGDFLNICREHGAMTVGIDYDPVLVKWLQLRGHLAFQCNILWTTKPLDGNLFKIINLRGSIVVEYFSLVGMGRLRKLLNRLERLRATDGAILVCPCFEVVGKERIRRTPDPLRCPFTEQMRLAGYEVTEPFSGQPDSMYPLLYVKSPKGSSPLSQNTLSGSAD